MRRSGLSFSESLWVTRPGNVFTTHTPVAAGFDCFPADLLHKYARYLGSFLTETGIELSELLALGRGRPNSDEPFNMAYLAMRGSLATFGVSRLHGGVSRRIFQPLFPRWPESEVPVGYVTNGVHVPSWDSSAADDLWTAACGKERWRGMPDTLPALVSSISDEQLWAMANEDRQVLIQRVRMRLVQQLTSRGHPPEVVDEAANVLDPKCIDARLRPSFHRLQAPEPAAAGSGTIGAPSRRSGEAGSARSRRQVPSGRWRGKENDPRLDRDRPATRVPSARRLPRGL